MVQVGAQVAVTAKPGTGIILQQQQHKHMQGVLLEKGACIGRATALVKTAFVTDTDATCIPTQMCIRDRRPCAVPLRNTLAC